MTDTPQLAPCPHCDGPAELIRPANGSRPYVMCAANFCTGPKPTEAEAVAAWNRRAQKPLPTVTALWPIITCHQCGTRTADGRAVLHAVGHYCPTCAPAVTLAADRHARNAILRGMESGHVSIPTPDYDPKGPNP